MEKVIELFLEYVQIDTESAEESTTMPSTMKQHDLAALLEKQLREMGAAEIVYDKEHCYVYASIPATVGCEDAPVIGFIAHMDTSPAVTGAGVKPRIIENYDGRDIVLSEEKQVVMRVADFPELASCQGKRLIVTDGTTLLGADDKAGVAEIMAMAQYLINHPEIPHGTIKIGFTPDEEVGRGADLFDVEGFGADVAYTVDGGALGELEYETFNAASAKVTVHGFSIHPGSAKGKMKNSILMAMEFQRMLPGFDTPAYTQGYEGFFHLTNITGEVEETVMDYIIRDHDMKKFEQKKEYIRKVAEFLNLKYGEGTIELVMKDSYYNMKEKLKDHMYLIDIAQEAMDELWIAPIIEPVRGGTDGARLSYMGLPCPNLCTGGHNFHGKFEYIPVQSMEKVTKLLVEIVKKFEEREW